MSAIEAATSGMPMSSDIGNIWTSSILFRQQTRIVMLFVNNRIST